MQSPRLVMRRFGGSSQLRINTIDDLKNVRHLPEAHWAVLSCPVKGLNCDDRFLELIDDDDDGRIGTNEVKHHIEWCLERLDSKADFFSAETVLQLKDLTETGQYLKDAAIVILDNLKIENKDSISLKQIRQREAILKDAGNNGDGVITIACMPDDESKKTASDIAACVTLVKERNGRDGLNKACLNDFKKLRDQAFQLHDEGAAVHFWGTDSSAHCNKMYAIRQEVSDWFALGHLQAVNPELAKTFITQQGKSGAARDRAAIDQALEAQLIADPQTDLQWANVRATETGNQLLALKDIFFAESDSINRTTWNAINAEIDIHLAWQQKCTDNKAYKLGVERLQQLNDEHVLLLEQACDADAALAKDLSHIDDLERLILGKRWILEFANNFISLPHLFDHSKRAMFEQGMLLIAGREYHLAVHVGDRKQHVSLAKESGMCICYIAVSGDQPPRNFEVAVPITAGTRAGLFVGRRGIFHDINGRRLEAIIVEIIDNPVSIREAIFQPFSRIANFFSNKIENWSSSVDKKFEQQVGDVVSDKPVQAPAAAAPASPGFGSTLMGGSVAFAALGSSLAFITKQLSELQPLKIAFGLAVLMLLIMIPTAVIAYLKLRRRNLSALLQASAWAVNDRMILNYSLGRLLSCRPALPKGAVSETRDELDSFLKQCNIEDDREGRFKAWAIIATFATGALAIADIILKLSGQGGHLWLMIACAITALSAFYYGMRAWKTNLMLVCLFAILALLSLIYATQPLHTMV